MRHFLCLALAVATLACGVGVASRQAALVVARGLTHALRAHLSGTRSAAVPVAAVTVAANDNGGAAASAQVASWVGLHRHMRPTGLG